MLVVKGPPLYKTVVLLMNSQIFFSSLQNVVKSKGTNGDFISLAVFVMCGTLYLLSDVAISGSNMLL